MEYSTRFKDPYFSTTKSWAKERRSRKYGARRDVRKSTPNGENLRRAHRDAWDEGNIEIDCGGGINPIEKFLNIQNPNQTDIQSNLSSILQHSNPTAIRYERWNNRGEDFPYCMRTGGPTDGKGNRWSVYYRYSAQQQYEQFQHNLQREKALKKHGKEYVKEKMLRPKNWKKPKRRREYKPPTVDEGVIAHKKVDVVFDDRLQREYIQYDLGRNQWITAFSTRFEWRSCKNEIVHRIGEYKLYVAFDDEERDRRMFGIEDDDDAKTESIKRVRSKRSNSAKPTTTRQRRKRERKQMMKEFKTKKMRDKLKWEYVGCFDGSMKGFWFDQTKDFCVDIIHRINYTVYCDPKSNDSMKKHYAKNGKLVRWIKVVPCDSRDSLNQIHAQCYGVGVNAYSLPIIPYKCRDGSDFIPSGYTASDDEGYDTMDDIDGADADSDFEDGSKAKNLQIGPRIQDEEIEEGKGCRLVIHEQRPVLSFHREIDGILPGYRSPDWVFADIIRRKKEFHQTKKCMKKKYAKLSVKDWDINGVPLY